jgi:hypothetical protein
MSGSRLCRVLPTGVALAPGNTRSCEFAEIHFARDSPDLTPEGSAR